MNCRDFREFIDSYLSDELLTETNHDIIRHVEECPECRAEIEARRHVRARLRSAMRSAPDFQISGRFDNHLRASLKNESGVEKRSRWSFGFGRSWVAVAAAAGLVVAVTFGVLYYGRTDGSGIEIASAGPAIPVSALPASSLVNLAAEDHDHCAVKYASEKPPVEVAQVPVKFRDIANVVSHELKNVLKNCDLIDSHSCKFGKARFTHVILRDGNNMISVLVTNDDADRKDVAGKILSFASEKYSISQFDFDKRAIFVVSSLDNETNAQAAQALFVPIRKHLEDPVLLGTRPALLMAR